MTAFLSDQLRDAALTDDPDRSLIVAAADVIDRLFAERNQYRMQVQALDAEVSRLKASEGVW